MSDTKYLYYGGIEGGASNTKCALIRSDGKIVAVSEGEGTNQYLIGVDECLRRINSLVQLSFQKAGLPLNTVLKGLGMALSGGDEKPCQIQIKETVKKDYPSLAEHVFVGSDTQSVLATALPNGGVVLIAGTGSNCQLINPDGTSARCGGWGHLIGDEASAIWITLRAIKIFFDHKDGLVPCQFSVETVKDCIYAFYNIQTQGELLDHLYTNFNKAKFSGLCKELATVTRETKDPLGSEIFKEAGKLLAQHIYGISGKVHQDLKTREGGVPIVCVGSVFKSWDLLQSGFVQGMQDKVSETGINEITCLHLNTEASIGAAALGAKAAGQHLPMDYANNATVFFHSKL